MLRIVDETNKVIHEGDDHEMKIAFEYLTIPSYRLAKTRGYGMNDFYEFNKKYWTENARNAKGELRLVTANDDAIKLIIEIENGILTNLISNGNVQYVLIDWDNIKQGDELRETYYQPDLVVSQSKFNNILEENIKLANDFHKTLCDD